MTVSNHFPDSRKNRTTTRPGDSHAMNRNMKRIHLSLTTALALVPLGLAPLAAAAQEQLSIYNWGDYINPAVLEAFTEETGIEVTMDTYGSNEEMLAKIQAGATGYDIVFPSVHMHDIMFQLGLLAKTDIGAKPIWAALQRQR